MNIEGLMQTDQLHPRSRLSGVKHVELQAARVVRCLANTESVDGGRAAFRLGGN